VTVPGRVAIKAVVQFNLKEIAAFKDTVYSGAKINFYAGFLQIFFFFAILG
jgi:hypothetical protein